MKTRAPWIGYAAAFVPALCAGGASAQSPFASTVIEYDPAPGQNVNNAMFSNPAKALGPPVGGGIVAPGNSSIVTLGGFGGRITLKFDHTVSDDPSNPHGLDAIVFGNAFWVAGHPNRRYAECGFIEIALDANGNGMADPGEPWFLIPGSHIVDLDAQWQVQTWDDNIADATHPPATPFWIPGGMPGTWTTDGWRLPSAVFELNVVINPNGQGSTIDGIHGYADHAPTLLLGDLNGDNVIDAPTTTPAEFYTVPDDPFTVAIDPGSGGGDAFDIAWAVDPATGLPANLDGFDFIRITTAVNHVSPLLGEMSTEIDAVADVTPGLMGDADGDGDVDLHDYAAFIVCVADSDDGELSTECRIVDFNGDDAVDTLDFAGFQRAFTGG